MSKRRVQWILCITMLLLFIAVRVHLYQVYNSVWVDSDQTISWLMAQDISEGRMHTPYFYGQFYNINVDAWIGGIFTKIFGDVARVMPVVSNVLGLLPFLIGGLLGLRFRQYAASLLCFALAAALPTQFHMMTSTPRGFMGGLVVMSIGVLLFALTRKRLMRGLGVYLCVVSILINPNVVFLGIPIVALYFSSESTHEGRRIWPELVIGLVLALLSFLALVWFQNTAYLQEVHRLWDLEWKWAYLKKNLTTIDLRWRYTFPLMPKSGSWWLAVLAIVGLAHIRQRNKLMAWASLFTVVALILSLGLNKTLDGTNSVFFPFSRMYIALPLAFLVLVAPIVTKLQDRWKATTALILFFGLGSFMWNTSRAERVVVNSIRANDGTVQVTRIKTLRKQCASVQQLMQDYGVDFVVFYYKSDEYTYGCPCLEPKVKTIYPEYDRRLWTFNELGSQVVDRLLILDWSLSIDEKLTEGVAEVRKIDGEALPAYLVTGSTLNIIDLFERNNLTLRPH